jgi:V/A-type H+-transporting ATPase subunit F
MKIAAICDNDTAVGLRLAGLIELYIPNNDAVKIWNQISERDDIGIVFITEKIAEELDKYLKDYRIRNNIPIVVEIPDKKGHKKDHKDFVSLLIKKAVGVEVSKGK